MPIPQKTRRLVRRKTYIAPINNYTKDVQYKIASFTQYSAIVVAMLTCIIAIISTILSFQPLTSYLAKVSTATSDIHEEYIVVATFTPSYTSDNPFPKSTLTQRPLQEITTPALVTPVYTPMATELVTILTSSATEGNMPLAVHFSAEDSFATLSDGNFLRCKQSGLCIFTWAVYRNEVQVLAPFQGQSTFAYTFTGKGIYSVSVYVCYTSVCREDGVIITIR